MAEFTIAEVCQAVNGVVSGAVGAETVFSGISTDSRTVKPGNLFVAIWGKQFDGHEYVGKAVENGAGGVLVSREDIDLPGGLPVIVVDDTLAAYQSLARFHRLRFNIPVIAVTGSNGKTTAKDMTAAVLSSRFKVLKTEANFNNEIGLPLTLLNLQPEHEVAVVEMGMRGRGEIRELADIALPTVGIVTNVSETHIELLGSLENIADAKAELVEAISEMNGLAILNADDRLVKAMCAKTKGRVVFYGLDEAADVRADKIHTDGHGTVFECVCPDGVFQVFVPVAGKHNVYNALAAISAGLELGLSFAEVRAGLSKFQSGAMRLEIKQLGEYTVINDAYNASPLSTAVAIDALAEVAKGRMVVVLGDMLELGSIAVEAHRMVGVKLAEDGVRIVVTVGELASYIADTAQEKGVQAIACRTHGEAQEALREVILPGDTILIKGSRGMKMEKIIEMFK